MATHKGKEGTVNIGAQTVGELRSFEVTETANEVDTSTMGSDWTGVDSTQSSWKASANMFFDPDDAAQQLMIIGTKVAVEFYPQGETTGLVQQTGTALITSIGRPQAHDNIIERNFELTGDGALTTTVVS